LSQGVGECRFFGFAFDLHANGGLFGGDRFCRSAFTRCRFGALLRIPTRLREVLRLGVGIRAAFALRPQRELCGFARLCSRKRTGLRFRAQRRLLLRLLLGLCAYSCLRGSPGIHVRALECDGFSTPFGFGTRLRKLLSVCFSLNSTFRLRFRFQFERFASFRFLNRTSFGFGARLSSSFSCTVGFDTTMRLVLQLRFSADALICSLERFLLFGLVGS
jgi:hypothetical protein